MAYEKLLQCETAEAGVDLIGKQYHLGTFDAQGRLVLADGTDNKVVPIVEPAEAGRAASYALKGQAKVVYGGAVTKGAKLKSDANGKAVPAGAGEKSFGTAMVAGAANDIGTVELDDSAN